MASPCHLFLVYLLRRKREEKRRDRVDLVAIALCEHCLPLEGVCVGRRHNVSMLLVKYRDLTLTLALIVMYKLLLMDVYVTDFCILYAKSS